MDILFKKCILYNSKFSLTPEYLGTVVVCDGQFQVAVLLYRVHNGVEMQQLLQVSYDL